MKRTKQLDRVILFEIGLIIALLLVNWVLNMKYHKLVLGESEIDSAYIDSPFVLGPLIDPAPPVQKKQQQAMTIPFDPRAVLKQVDDLFKMQEPKLQLKKIPTQGPIGYLPIQKNQSFKVDTFVSEMPQYPGGETELAKFIQTKFQFTDRMYDHGGEILVVVRFVVKSDGQVSDIKVVKCSVPYVGAEVETERLCKRMPKWIPGNNGKEAVNVFLQIPLRITVY